MNQERNISRRTFLKASGALGVAQAAPMSAVTSGRPASQDGVTGRLARYVVASNWADFPEPARKEATRSVLNWVGCAVGGSREEAVDRTLAALSEFSGPRIATVIGRKERLDVLHATLVNGISSHVLDFDDTDLETIIHPAGPVASAILALAEKQLVSGKQFLHAFTLGVGGRVPYRSFRLPIALRPGIPHYRNCGRIRGGRSHRQAHRAG